MKQSIDMRNVTLNADFRENKGKIRINVLRVHVAQLTSWQINVFVLQPYSVIEHPKELMLVNNGEQSRIIWPLIKFAVDCKILKSHAFQNQWLKKTVKMIN